MTFCCMSFMYCENHAFVSWSPVIMMLWSNVTTPVGVGGGACSGPIPVPESDPDDDIVGFSSAERAMERARVGCLWWRRERDWMCGEEGGWRWRREERAVVRQRPASETSSCVSPLTSSDVRTGAEKTQIGERERERFKSYTYLDQVGLACWQRDR